jgi:hypothetical protein
VPDEKDKPQVTLSSNSNEPPAASAGGWSRLDGKPLWSPPNLEHTPQQGDRFPWQDDLAEVAEKTYRPDTTEPEVENRMHPLDRRFYVILLWAGIPVALIASCLLAWASGQLPREWAIAGIIIGLLGMAAATYYALEVGPPSPRYPGPIILSIAALTWLLVGWQTWIGFHTQVQGYTQAQLDSAVSEAERTLQSKLDETIRQRDADTAVTVHRARKLPEPVPPAPSDVPGPISWNFNGQLIVASGGGQTAEVHGLIFQGQSTMTLRFKEAYAVSGLTGHKVELKANVQQIGAYFPVTDVDVPADAPVQLDLIFQPPLSIRDFFDQWGKFRIVISYENGGSLQHEFDERSVREKLQQQIPYAFGPRVTPREISK